MKKPSEAKLTTPGPAGLGTPAVSAGPEAAAAPAPGTAAPAATVSLTPQELETLKAEAAKAKQHWDQLLRTAAELDNYRKRVARERAEAAQYAFAPLLHKLLPVLDHFDMALAAAAAPANASNNHAQSFEAGVRLIHQQLKTALAEAGLEEINALGQSFDPNLHEAVAQQESAEAPEGRVLQQLRKGYKLHDRLLRPASVVVAKAPAAAVPTAPAPTPASEPPAAASEPA